MAKHNAANERIKRDYFRYLKEANRRSVASIDAVAKALARFDEANGYKDWRKFRIEQAVAFKAKLDKQLSERTGEKLSRATVHSTLAALRSFFIWLADRPGYKARISYADADYFNLSEKDVRIATTRREKPFPSLEQMHHVLSAMPHGTDIERRDRALVAFTLLTGTRDGALIGLKLKHVDMAASRVDLDARDIATKFSKTFSTWFFPVGGEAVAILSDWIEHLRGPLLRGESDALFPDTKMDLDDEGEFVAVGLERHNWKTADPVRRIFREAFATADLPYFRPHSIRQTLVQLGERQCRTPEEFKAWSQNLGHEHVLTTLTSYGNVAAHRQGELIKGLGITRPAGDDAELLASLAAVVRQYGGGAPLS